MSLDVKYICNRKAFTRWRNVYMWCPKMGMSHPVKKDKSRSILISGNELIPNERIACMSKMRKRYYKYDLVE